MPMIVPAVAAAVTWVSSAAAAATAALAGAIATTGISATLSASIAAGTLKLAATALGSLALNAVLAPRVGSAGSPVSFKADPSSPIRGVMGYFGTGGTQAHMRVWGKDNLMISYMVILSLGPIQGISKFEANELQVNFPLPNGEAARVEPYRDKMWMTYKMGLPTDGALSPPPNGGNPRMEWDGNHRTSGYAAAFWTMQNNSKKASYESGVPKPLWSLQGQKLYDPRFDSTQTAIGGSGPQRLNDWRTWGYSENPQVHAFNWALGHHKKLEDGSIDRKFLLAGVGARPDQIDLTTMVAGMNVSDANGWKISGEWNSQDDKWQTFAAMLQAGGSSPIHVGAKIGIMTNAPKVPVATITSADVIGNMNIKVMASRRDRFNTVYPRYLNELQNWDYSTAGAVTSTVYTDQDGGEERPKELTYNYVRLSLQAGQLAAYDLANTRESLKLAFPAKPYLVGIKPGDAVLVNDEAKGLVNQKFIVTARPIELMEGTIGFELRSETDSKHPWALGQADSPAPSPALSPINPAPSIPADETWTVLPQPPSSGGVSQPGLVVGGEVPDGIGSILVQFGPTANGPWQQAYSGPPTSDNIPIPGLQPGEQYYVSIIYYSVKGYPSDPLVKGPFTTPQLIAGDTLTVGGVSAGSLVQFYQIEWPQALDDLEEARNTLYTATSGLVDRTQALFNRLDTPITGIVARLTTVESRQTTDNSAAIQRLDALETTVNTPSTGVVARLATAESAISTNNQAAVDRLNVIEGQINTPATGILARMTTSENLITSLQSGKADASRMTLLETRARSLPNLIEDGDFSQEALGINWYREGGPSSQLTYNPQIGNYLSIQNNNYVASKEYPCQVGGRLAVSWDGDSTDMGAHIYLQVLPSYDVVARAFNSASLNSWNARKFSIPAQSIPIPAGSTAFRVVISPNGGDMNVSRIKVNFGDEATFWSDELTTRSVGASISQLETVTSDLQLNKASAQSVRLLQAGSDSVYLTDNTDFAVYDNAAQTGFTTPDFWGGWGEKVNDSHRVPGHIGQYAWRSHNNAGGGIGTGDCGISQDFNGNSKLRNLPSTWYVLEADIWFGAGQIGGAGVLAYFDQGDQMRLDFALDKPVGRDTSFGYDASPTGLWSFRKLVKPANVGNGNLIFHVMTEWDGFEGGARPKVIEWQRCGLRFATPQEVAAERADAAAGSALARVTTVETATSELTARGGGGGNLVGNATLQNTVGWTVSLPNNAESTLDRANTGINYPSDNNWHPFGENCLSTHVNARDDTWYMDWFSDTFALEPGKTYEFGARAGVHRTGAQCYLQVSNIDGSQATYPQATLTSNGQVTMTEEFQGGKDLSAYGQFWGKYTVPATGGFTRGRLILRRFSTNVGQANSWSWWTRPFCREIPSTQTRPSPWDSGASQWNLRASWQQGTTVPGADTFISALSTLADGRATSSVAIGAQLFSVFNQVGQNWIKALEVKDGNALFSGGLQAGAFIRLGNGNGWPVALKPVDFNAGDGEVVSFGTDLGSIPQLSFAQNNLAPLNNGETYDVKALNISATGFTLYAKINIPADPANQSANTTKANFSVNNYPGVQLYLDGKPEAADGTYTIYGSGVQNHCFIGKQGQQQEADSYSYAYTTIQIYAYKGGWQLIAERTVQSVVDPYQYPSGQMHTTSGPWDFQETMQLGSGVTHVGIVRVGSDNGQTGYVGTTGPVSWQSQGSGSGVRTATPNGRKTRITVRPQ